MMDTDVKILSMREGAQKGPNATTIHINEGTLKDASRGLQLAILFIINN